MQPLVAFVAPAGINLAPLTAKLWAERLSHRVVVHPSTGEQQLLVASSQDLARVNFWLEQWQLGELETTPANQQPSQFKAKLAKAFQQAPLTSLVLIALVGFYLVMQFSSFWHSWLSTGQELWPHHRNQLATYVDLGLWQLWRPVLLHFSLAHLIFNTFAWWIFASRIETRDGKLALVVLIVLAGLAGNIWQWWAQGPAFGGASGITFALLGWLGLRIYVKRIDYNFPALMLPLMLGIMVLMLVADSLIPGLTRTAHAAHLGGLILGLLVGLAWPKPKEQDKT